VGCWKDHREELGRKDGQPKAVLKRGIQILVYRVAHYMSSSGVGEKKSALDVGRSWSVALGLPGPR